MVRTKFESVLFSLGVLVLANIMLLSVDIKFCLKMAVKLIYNSTCV